MVAETLVERGHSVRIFDRFCYLPAGVSAEALFRPMASGASGTLELVTGDIRRLQETPELLDGIEAIVHLASLSNDPSCDLDEDMAYDVNTESTRELARLAVERGVRRFVFSSSCAVYGRGVFELLDEESPANPVSSFGKSKLAAEQAVLRLASPEFEPVVARMATLFGWSRRMRFDLAINQMVATALRQQRITVRGGGSQWRPFVHVRDAADATALLVESPAHLVAGEVFNVGSDLHNVRIRDLAERVARHLPGTAIETFKDDDDQRNYRVQFGKVRGRLNFICQWSMDEGIEEVRRGLEANPDLDPFDEQHFNVAKMKTLLATPVDEGGEPVAARFIPLSRPSIGAEEEEAVLDALRSGWLTSGPQVGTFERLFAETVRAPHAIGVVSCTAALHLSMVQLGVGPGDEVIMPPITWASTGNTIVNMGAKVRFVDVEPDTLNMNPELLEAAISGRTKAIMPVHMAGHPCDMDRINAIARRHGVPVIEDAAHALGASYKGVPIGALGTHSCFSFYAIKNITTMEGGMITLADPDAAARLRLLAANGMTATAWDRYGRSAVPTPAQVVTPGYKYALGNVGAAMGVVQLKKFAAFKAARNRLAGMYRAVLSDVDEITLPVEREGVEHAWHLFIVRLNLDKLNRSRDEIAHDLRRENIGTGVHFYGLHLHPYYRETLGMRAEDYPEATRASEDILSLPLHPQITDKNLHEVVFALKKVLAHRRK
jgi:dTDP-4-amino-4,6-dideoxygalactose transaminase/nucleoside-diphosphate-sugar epimerase